MYVSAAMAVPSDSIIVQKLVQTMFRDIYVKLLKFIAIRRHLVLIAGRIDLYSENRWQKLAPAPKFFGPLV